MLPCVIFEDEHLLVVNKPAGLNTHAPSPWLGDGIYEWLRDREPRWASLAIIHRLDKETSGLLVFGLSTEANRSLTAQFAGREVAKKYLLLTDRTQSKVPALCRSCIQRSGEKYLSRPVHAGGDLAETGFRHIAPGEWGQQQPGFELPSGTNLIEAIPLTGRTHQIRVHAAEAGFPILGDTLYGGSAAERVFLHAGEIQFRHPVTGKPLKFNAPLDFKENARTRLRKSIIDPEANSAYRLIHGAADGWPDTYIEKLGSYLLLQSPEEIRDRQKAMLRELMDTCGAVGAYHRVLTKHARGRGVEASPVFLFGEEAPAKFEVLENGLLFELSLREGYSVGLFLDQRENRRRLAVQHIGVGFEGAFPSPGEGKVELLNTFAYTCGFSVAAAKSGIRTTSLDLSKKYLDWGKRNFVLNGMDPAEHDFIFGDVFDWMKRLRKKNRKFDIVVLDPPTFSQSRESGVFRADRDYGELVAGAVELLKEDGVLLASTNAATWEPAKFAQGVKEAAQRSRRRIIAERFSPQPIDFPITRNEPGYLKTLWLWLRQT